MKKTYPTEVLLSITTGVLLCEFRQLHECSKFLMESPIWAHQVADKALCEILKSAILHQHPQLATANADGVGKDNWTEFRDRMIKQFGPKLSIEEASTLVSGSVCGVPPCPNPNAPRRAVRREAQGAW